MKQPLHLRCEGVIRMSRSVNAYWLRLLDCDRYGECNLGKHLLLSYPDSANRLQQRWYSIAGKPEAGIIEIAVKRQSDRGVSASIHNSLTENSMVIAEHVTGVLTSQTLLGYGNILMICGGIGITLPLGLARGLARLRQRGSTVPGVHLIACVPRFDDLIYFAELLSMQAQYPWFSVSTFVTRERVRAGIPYLASGRPNLHSLADEIDAPDAVVVCGSSSFVTAWKRQVRGTFPHAVILDQHEQHDHFVDTASYALEKAAPSTIWLAERELELHATRDHTLLEILEANAVEIPNQCRVGVCGRCRVRVLDGEVESASDIGLSARERESGYRLSCCTRPCSEKVSLAL
jgi:ferredoxin-NADP reductase